jgi:hypothetical protein
MDSMVPVISAAVGGALAIAGAYLNSLTSHKRQRNAENRSRTANKLEDAARLAQAIRKSGMGLRVKALGIPLGAKDEPPTEEAGKNDSDEFILLLRLYEPILLPHAKALVDADMAVSQSVVNQLSDWAFADKPTPENYQQFASSSEELIAKLDEAYDQFMTALAARFSEYRL